MREAIDRVPIRFARYALAAAFLSAVASRFGLWGGGSWTAFEEYTAQVNSFMPTFAIPIIARIATALELGLAIALLAGMWPRYIALATAGLLAIFGAAMTISFGPKSPLDYSVFSASACALLLARAESREALLERANRASYRAKALGQARTFP